jgi:hypothetical protein
MNKYIVLATQDDSLSKWFRVVEGGYQEQITKNSEMAKAITGALDVKEGKPLEARSCLIRVRHTELDGSPYGTRADLRSLFLIHDPTDADAPSLLKMTDHYGDDFDVYLWGEMMGQPLSVIIEGTEAWFVYQVQVVINPV